jgi:hypothetical protein
LPALTYGCELWAFHPRYRTQRDVLVKTVHRHLSSLAGTPVSIPHVMLPDLLGIPPLTHHWNLRAVSFWCKLWDRPGADFWRNVVLDNWVDFAVHGVNNFSAGIAEFYASLPLPFAAPYVEGQPPVFAASEVLPHLQAQLDAIFASVEPDPRTALHPILCTYSHYCRRPEGCTRPPLHVLPLSLKAQRQLFRFMCGCHGLPVHAGRIAVPPVPRSQRCCLHCGPPFVGDERHMIFDCPAVQPLRNARPFLFTHATRTVSAFVWQAKRFQVARFLLDALAVSVPQS